MIKLLNDLWLIVVGIASVGFELLKNTINFIIGLF